MGLHQVRKLLQNFRRSFAIPDGHMMVHRGQIKNWTLGVDSATLASFDKKLMKTGLTLKEMVEEPVVLVRKSVTEEKTQTFDSAHID